jgi:DNA polymerase III epsilon subunit-like protein
MSSKERVRLEALGRVKRGELTMTSAAELMGVSLRQGWRVWKRFKSDGDAGLVHELRGRVSNRRLSQDVRERVVKRHQERYADFGPTLACEKLAEEGLAVSPNTLTALLKGRGLWQRRRRRGKHRKRRERRACFGSMVQMDGSHHDWLEGRAPRCVLMVLIDDATSRTYARFYPAETTEAAFDAFGRWAGVHGLPRSVYVDRHSIYRDEDHPEKPTQFGRAMKELGVELIAAHSPQAKGRVERRHAVFQDRLVKEMRLRNLCTIAQGNALLESMFLDDLNGRYAVKAHRGQDLHRAVEAAVVLEEVLCVQEHRVVGNDWCVRWNNRWLQIGAEHAALNLPRRRVLVKQLADGRLLVQHQGQTLTARELTAQERRSRPAGVKAKKPIVNNRRWKPSADHPWNRAAAERAVPRVSPAPAAPARDLHAEKKRKAG